MAAMTILTFIEVIVLVQLYIHIKFGFDWFTSYGIRGILKFARKSNMAAKMSDRDELRNLTSPHTNVHMCEIWALAYYWFWRRRFLSVFWKSKMAAKSCDLDKPKYAKIVPTGMMHILSKFQESSSNAWWVMSNYPIWAPWGE